MSNDHVHGHEAEAQKLWAESEQLEFIKGFKVGKSVAEIIGQFDLTKTFDKKSEVLGCSDGRIEEHRLGGAGNFILASDVEREKFIMENKGKIKVVKSHDGCGAAGIKFKQMVEAGEQLPEGVTTSDELGIYYCKKLAEALGSEHEHTGAAEMSGAVHNERVIYFDGTGKINPKSLPELPAGFICSGLTLGLSSEYQKVELGELAKIALGDHGFGERFNKDNPLYIVVSAKDQDQLDQLIKVAEQAKEEFQGKVVVDGFIAK